MSLYLQNIFSFFSLNILITIFLKYLFWSTSRFCISRFSIPSLFVDKTFCKYPFLRTLLDATLWKHHFANNFPFQVIILKIPPSKISWSHSLNLFQVISVSCSLRKNAQFPPSTIFFSPHVSHETGSFKELTFSVKACFEKNIKGRDNCLKPLLCSFLSSFINFQR